MKARQRVGRCRASPIFGTVRLPRFSVSKTCQTGYFFGEAISPRQGHAFADELRDLCLGISSVGPRFNVGRCH